MYIYLATGRLPWSDDIEKYSNKEFLIKSIIKKNIFIEDLCRDLPKEFCDYMNHVKKLNFEEEPNYEYLKSLFKNLLLNIDKFTWVEQNNDNHQILLEKNSFNNNLNKSKIIIGRLLKNNNLNKNDKITKISKNYIITNIITEKKLFNKKNESKEKSQFLISKTNSFEIEGIEYINNHAYIKSFNNIGYNSIIKSIKKKESHKNNQFLKIKEYFTKFPKKIKSSNLTNINNKIKYNNNNTDINNKIKGKINNSIKKNNYNINKNTNTTLKNNLNSKNNNKNTFTIDNNKYNNNNYINSVKRHLFNYSSHSII